MSSTAEATSVLPAAEEGVATAIGRWRRLGLIIRDNPLGVFGLVVVIILAFLAIFAPLIATHDPEAVAVGPQLSNPTASNLFGTNDLGQDMFSRVVFGARISLIVGFVSVIFGTSLGAAIGIFSGYIGGWIDSFIQRGVDTLIAFPGLLLLLILRQVLGASLQTLIIAIGLLIIPGVARVVRGAVLSERNNQYVEAARALGASTPRILVHHIAPNVAALAIIIGTTLLGTAILAEASLSFLGLGVSGGSFLGIELTDATWGKDVSQARDQFPVHIWWAFFPGAAITLTVLGFNLLGDALRDIFDPRLRGRL